jgi:hypothetical protein
MKKTLTIILLSISLSGFSQTERGDWVITPTVGWNSFINSSGSEISSLNVNYKTVGFKLPISTHYYLSDRFGIGLVTTFRYTKFERFNNDFYSKQKSWAFFVEPEMQYNFLKTRFTPFIRVNYLGFLWLDHSDVHVETLVASSIDDTKTEFFNGLSFSNLSLNVGVTYYVKERFGLQTWFAGISNSQDGFKANFYTPINFGLQFIINNPRPEVESPR